MDFQLSILVVVAAVSLGLSASVLSATRGASLLPIDTPNERSSHIRPTPRGAGVWFLPAAWLAFLVADVSPGPLSATFGLWVATILGLLGFSDDLNPKPVSVRLLVQVSAIGWLTWTALDDLIPGALTLVVGVSLVGLLNAVNFMDGINGISTFHALIAGIYFQVLGATEGIETLQLSGLVLAGTALAFFPFNFPRARLFLGDAGSYFWGSLICFCILSSLSSSDLNWSTAWYSLAPMLVYAVDTGGTLVRRALNRSPLFAPHRQHVYQRLADLRSHGFAAGLSAMASAAVCLFVYSSSRSESISIRFVFMAAALAVLGNYWISPSLVARRGV